MTLREKSSRVPPRVTDLLIDVWRKHLSTGAPSFSTATGGTWGEFDLAQFGSRLELRCQLILWLNAAPEGAFAQLHRMMRLRNKPLSLRLADGSTVRAEFAHMIRLGDEARVQLHHWDWQGSGVPEFWVGRVRGSLPQSGNLDLIERHRAGALEATSEGFCLQGKYDWYLLPTPRQRFHRVIVDAHGEAVEREALVRDVLAMQLSLGAGLELDYLLGIDRERRCVGAISVEHFWRRSPRHRSPVPDDIYGSALWVPEFFRLLAAKLGEEGLEPLLIAITSYLDAEADHLDGGYLKAQVGLEAFAKRLVGGDASELLVRDEAAWIDWVDSLRPVIAGHVPDPERRASVIGKLQSARFAPTGDLVRRAFAQSAIHLPREVLTEIKKRNKPAHGFLMNSVLEHDIDRDHRRLEMIQTLLASLVALHIGYGGPLKGYDVGADGRRPSPGWWPLSTSGEDAEVRFLAERASSAPAPGVKAND